MAAREEAHKIGIPCVLVEGFAEPYLASSLQHLLVRNSDTYQYTKQVIAVSKHTLSVLRAHYFLPEHLGTVVHYGRPDRFFSKLSDVDRVRFLESIGIPSAKCIVTMIARLTYVKGHDILLSALDYLSAEDQVDQFHFVIAGTGDLENTLKEAVSRSAYSSCVIFV
jgi:glycosyltransferase involved in cell wall biosynthesis